MKILIAGITGSIGSTLAPRLLAAGHEVCGLSRTARAATSPSPRARQIAPTAPASPTEQIALTQGDVISGAGLDDALSGVEVAYFLVHSMEASTAPTGFAERELQGARNFAAAAARSGVERIVFLGGMLPVGATPSPHLASRLRVEQTLLDAVPDSVALRASIVIGESSRSFRLLVRLIERMPVLPLPAWQRLRTTPIDQRDVIECLVRAATAGRSGEHGNRRGEHGNGRGSAPSQRSDHPVEHPLPSNSLDLAGPEIVTYAALINRISDVLLINRPIVPLELPNIGPLQLPGIAQLMSLAAAAIADEDPGLVTPLMQSLEADILPQQPDAAAALGQRLHSLDAAIEHAIKAWDEQEPLRAR